MLATNPVICLISSIPSSSALFGCSFFFFFAWVHAAWWIHWACTPRGVGEESHFQVYFCRIPHPFTPHCIGRRSPPFFFIICFLRNFLSFPPSMRSPFVLKMPSTFPSFFFSHAGTNLPIRKSPVALTAHFICYCCYYYRLMPITSVRPSLRLHVAPGNVFASAGTTALIEPSLS